MVAKIVGLKSVVRPLGVMFLVTGLFVSAVLKAETVSINFREADIRSVIEAVAEITGKSFVLDPRVRGEITIISPEPIESELLYEAVLSALQVQGFQAVYDGAVIRVVPFAQSFQIPSGVMGSELQTKVIRVNHVRANELLPVLKPMMSRGSLLQAYDAGNNLVATDTVSQIAQLERVLAEIDVPEQSAIDVINLRHISAAEALHIASQMQNLQQQNLSIVEDSFNNRIIVGGPRTGRAAFREMLKSLDVPTDSNGGVEVLYLNYSKAEEIKPILDGMLESETFLAIAGEGAGGAEGGSRSGYRIEAEVDNNALVIAASASVIDQIRDVVRKLDRPRSQVLIEAVIAEVSQEQANRLNVQLAGASRYTGGILTNFDNLIPTLIGVAADGDVTDSELSNINLNTGVYLSAGDFDQDNGEAFGVIVDALRTDSRTTILSSPSVVTLDNSEAELTVGQEVPFITGSYTNSNNSSSNPFQTIEREEVGVKLKVIPQINEGDAVRLEIEQESSSIAGTATSLGTADTVTNKRTITTNVMVGDGQLLILGGLMDDNFGRTDRKVPVLGDLPILGGLFRNRNNNDDQRVLMMFIRPTILRSPAQSTATTNRRFDYLRNYDMGNGQTLGETSNTVLEQFEAGNQEESQGTVVPEDN